MISLLDFIEEHRDAVASDLIDKGLRLRDFPSDRLTYGDLAAIIRNAPRTSAIARSVDPERAEWGVTDYLLAQVADAGAWLVWAKSADGAKGRNRPKPIPRPGWTDDSTETDTRHFGSDPVPLDELVDFLGWEAELTT